MTGSQQEETRLAASVEGRRRGTAVRAAAWDALRAMLERLALEAFELSREEALEVARLSAELAGAPTRARSRAKKGRAAKTAAASD